MNLKIKIIHFGKASGDTYSSEIERFAKMSRPWASIEYISLKSPETSNEPVDNILDREAKLIRKHISSGSFVVALGEEGKLLNSYEFAKLLEKVSLESREIIFLIGSAFGLAKEIKGSAEMLLSLSSLTFPYKLCKLVFAEQIYRGLSICNNHPYHKE